MKCTRCSAEIPGQAQFCMRCGTPVAAARSGGTVTMARPAAMSAAHAGPNKKLIAGIAAALLLLLVAAFFGWKALTNRAGVAPGPSRVLEARGVTPTGGPLTERAGRVSNTGPLTTKPGVKTPAAPPPQDVIDYLAWLKQIERQRVIINNKVQMTDALKMSASVTADPLKAEMEEKQAPGYSNMFDNLQKKFSEMVSENQALAQQVAAKQPPQSCQELHNKYYDMLRQIIGSVQNISTALGSGDMGKALESVQGMGVSGPGSASEKIDEAGDAADAALDDVIKKYNLDKMRFTITTRSRQYDPFSR